MSVKSITVPIRMEVLTKAKFVALWLRLKSADPAVSQGETLEMAMDALTRELDGKTGRAE